MAGPTVERRAAETTPPYVDKRLKEFVQVFADRFIPPSLLLPCDKNGLITSRIDRRDLSPKGVRKIFDITQRDGRVDVSVQLQFDNGSDMRMARLIARRETDGWSSPSIAFYSNRAHPVEDQISKEEAYINAEEAFGL
ncbi:MAG: hypothetical protein A2186_02580 [Candidatus Levybacteria bacterium RIFOXYA1_FULL_41_10]|nr:MAG: hypothetical protein UT46_C0004G0037 [Candidatus Levybacteria bacterium GW2011_GWA1_39_34]KKR51290.1 MAG: hypothetical protein UT87_C0007G0050 [Candidatus Levybacteria bacterium GW2011_GWC1_40_19]KKR73828.1 MAG: hypothetical protein UU15_C0001G0003 [Candidatus Levybacteria bacterium GW2011_GWC2_40_7]KKR94624.1 MAG: hypothetical protein UU45_C0008G0024 [Candidatus Levybacteria bacterium GW2011_GWA2_41_15]KKS00726.1 MAG: hypothetical protein UU52_C0027G0007 [Candidatus Levybacteria bacter